MELVKYIFGTLGTVLFVYTVVRLSTAAYFKSREDYDKRRKEKQDATR